MSEYVLGLNSAKIEAQKRQRNMSGPVNMVISCSLIEDVADHIDAQQKELEALKDLCKRLKQEAKIHAQEARTQRSIVHEIYQAAGVQKGGWDGAEPVRKELEALRAENEALKSESITVFILFSENHEAFDWCFLKYQSIDAGIVELVENQFDSDLPDIISNMQIPEKWFSIDILLKNFVFEEGQMTFPETGQWDFAPRWDYDAELISIELTPPEGGA